MADFTALKTSIQNAIKQNSNEEITGNLLQEVLLAIVTTLGDGSINELITALGSEATTRSQADGTLQQNIEAEATTRSNADTALGGRIDGVVSSIEAINDAIENGYVYAGIATPSSTPASGKVFYLALTAGTYTNFGNTAVTQGINILKYNGSAWSLDAFVGIDDTPTPSSQKLIKSGGVFDEVMKNGSAFDLSAYNGGATYADLNAALTALNALPAAYKRGGMSMKFVLSSDNKYVQYRLTADDWSTDTEDWAIAEEGVYVENPEFVEVRLDNAGHILWAIKTDGSIYYGAGVPQQVIDYIQEKIKELSLEDIVAFLNGLEEGDKTLQTLLNEKVDKEEGKSLIDENYASSQSAINNPEYLQFTTDSDDKILEGIKQDGTKVIGGDLSVGGSAKILGNIEVSGVSYILSYNPEWSQLILDNNGKIIEGTRKNGEKYFGAGIEDEKINEELLKIKSDITDLQDGQAPKFVYSDTMTTYQRIIDWAAGDNIYMIGQVTDVHSGGSEKYKVVGYLSVIGTIIGADLLCNAGDIGLDTSDTTGNAQKVFAMMFNTKKGMNGIVPWVFCKGNHERLVSLSTLGEIYNKSFNTVYKNCVFGDSYGNYGYIDNSEKKTRVYFLNTSDTTETIHYAMSSEQLTWFAETLADVSSDWNVVVLTHMCVDQIGRWNEYPTTADGIYFDTFRGILNGFANHTAGANSDTGISWDYTQSSAKLVCVLSGDSHFNNYIKRDGVNYIVRQGYQAAPSQMPSGATAPPVNWTTECSFDVLAIKKNGTAKVFRIGTGGSDYDLSITY